MSKLMFGASHYIKGLDPVADAFAGTVTSDVVNVSAYHVARFIVGKGVGTTGTSKLTVEACDNAAGDNPVAVPFHYQAATGSDDVPADVTAATAADGVTTTAGSSQRYRIEVDTARMPADKPWLRLKAVEVANDPVLGFIDIELLSPRYAAEVPETAIA